MTVDPQILMKTSHQNGTFPFYSNESNLTLCTSLFFPQKKEPWEAEKTVADMEEYMWEDSPSQKNILDLLIRMKGEGQEAREQLLERRDVQEYRDSVTRLKNEGGSERSMQQYKEAVKKVFNLGQGPV